MLTLFLDFGELVICWFMITTEQSTQKVRTKRALSHCLVDIHGDDCGSFENSDPKYEYFLTPTQSHSETQSLFLFLTVSTCNELYLTSPSLTLFESLELFHFRFPFYYELKIIFMLWLLLPASKVL